MLYVSPVLKNMFKILYLPKNAFTNHKAGLSENFAFYHKKRQRKLANVLQGDKYEPLKL